MHARAALRLTVHAIVLGLMLGFVIARGAAAQRAGDARLAVSRPILRGSPEPQPDSSTRAAEPVNAVRAIGGGLAGGLLGGIGGFYAGAAAASGCKGEMCGFDGALTGVILGEAIGVAVGAHYGSGGHGSLFAETMVSTAVGIGGIFAGVATRGILLPFVPALQVMSVLAMER